MGENFDALINCLFKHQLEIKMFHFQTTSFAAHKASDEYLAKYEKNLDKLMEAIQGKYGRMKTSRIAFDFTTHVDQNIVPTLEKFAATLCAIDKLFKNCNGLSNIKDDMLVDISLLKYLLSFK